MADETENGAANTADDKTYEEIFQKWDTVLKDADEADAMAALTAEPEQEAEQGTEVPQESAAGEEPEGSDTQVVTKQPETASDPVQDLLAKARAEASARAQQKQERNFEQEIANARAEAEALKSRLKQSPLDVIKELGLDPVDIANHAYAEALGDDAPPEFKSKLSQSAVERRVEQKLRELEQREQQWQQAQQQREVQARISQLDNELVATVMNAPTNYKLFKQAADSDQNYAYEALVEAARNLYEATGQLPTAQKVVELAEAGIEIDLSRKRKLFPDAFRNSDAETQATEGTGRKQAASKTLSDTDTAERPSRRSAPQPDAHDTDAWIRSAIRKTTIK